LQEILCKKKIHKSLSTTDRGEAEAALPAVTQEIRSALIHLFRVLLSEVDPTAELPDGELICDDINLTPKKKPYSRKVTAAIERIGFIGAGNRLFTSDEEAIRVCRFADRLIEQSRIDIRPFSNAYWQFCRNVRRVQRDAVFAGPEDNPRSPVIDGCLNNEERRQSLQKASLGDVIRKYRDETGPGWSDSYRRSCIHHFEMIIELLGENTPVRTLTRADFKELRDILDALPPNYRNMARWKHLSIREASARAAAVDLPGRSMATVHKTMIICRAIMAYAEAEGYVERNCVIRLFRRQPPSPDKRIMPFSGAQLERLFTLRPMYSRAREAIERDSRFWIPLIALWTGMRLSEIGQLQAADLQIRSGVPVLVIEPEQHLDAENEKRLKTPQSARTVPVHPELQRIGLLDYHRSISEAGFAPLFPDLHRGRYSRQYDVFRHQVTNDMARADVRSQNHSFRSFRHNFRDALREAGIADEYVRRLGGWTLRTIADGYGAGPSDRRLYEEMKRITYPVDLTHLHVIGATALD